MVRHLRRNNKITKRFVYAAYCDGRLVWFLGLVRKGDRGLADCGPPGQEGRWGDREGRQGGHGGCKHKIREPNGQREGSLRDGAGTSWEEVLQLASRAAGLCCAALS